MGKGMGETVGDYVSGCVDDGDLVGTFTPLKLTQDRGWTEAHTLFKQLSVKVLSDKLKIVIDRGITENAYGSPILVTPLPKLTRLKPAEVEIEVGEKNQPRQKFSDKHLENADDNIANDINTTTV